MKNDFLADTLFYSMEKAIKSYRQHAQQRIAQAGYDVTIDQWLVLKTLKDNPGTTLRQVAVSVFKDVASITRIVQLLESKGCVKRSVNKRDGRRSTLLLTPLGESTVGRLQPIVASYRRSAVKGISARDQASAHAFFDSVIANCQSESRS